MCSCPDCCQGCPSVTAAALLLICSAMLQNLSFGRELKARAITASSLEYGFCSDLLPNVEENVMSLMPLCTDANILMALPIPTASFHAELLTAMHTAQPVSACFAAVPLVMVCTHFSHGASMNRLMVSNSSITMSLSASAT